MFAKAFKHKSYNPLKGSARKNLVQKIQATYPVVKEDDLKELVPLKSPLSTMKLTTSAGDDVVIHIVDNLPMMIELQDAFYPTVYAMWRCPHMIPTLTIYDTVACRFQDGNYHVTRGHIFIPPRGKRLPQFRKGSIVAVNMTDNKAAILVGTVNYSTEDLPQVQRGQCVKTVHMYGDLLCRYEKFSKIERPKLGEPFIEDSNTVSEDLSKLTITDNRESTPDEENGEENQNSELSDPHQVLESNDTPIETDEESKQCDNDGFPLDMDELFRYCLLCVIKTQGKKMQLPLKTNLLYANNMTTFCPSDRPLDLKKSTYKKLGRFLEAMEKDGILQVKPLEKGVDAVVKVNFDHPSIKQHTVIPVTESSVDTSNKKKNDDGPIFSAPLVKEMYKVTAVVAPFFEPMNFKRGQVVSGSQVTTCLVAYVRRNNLQDNVDKTLVKVDPVVSQVTNSDVNTMTVTWENLKAAIMKKMTHYTEMTFSDGSTSINSGKLPIITMQVANRSGNKKVTIVSNLHFYGISLNTLSKECQHGVAASCTITKSPGSKFDQLLVQGNQTYFLAKHLTEFYGLPKRFIEGADKILAKKKQ